jgi:hypothetical protein
LVLVELGVFIAYLPQHRVLILFFQQLHLLVVVEPEIISAALKLVALEVVEEVLQRLNR